VQTYLWALPALNMYGMKDGSEKVFGQGYNILPIFKERLNAKTLITTPNSDVIYALGYLDLKGDGPMVIEVPPGLQGILDDFWQRPICSEGKIDGRVWCGDVGLPGPDKGLQPRQPARAPLLHRMRAVLVAVCASCNAANQPGEKFCGGCGARLPTEASAPGAPTPARARSNVAGGRAPPACGCSAPPRSSHTLKW
jgi:hypothetical protein